MFVPRFWLVGVVALVFGAALVRAEDFPPPSAPGYDAVPVSPAPTGLAPAPADEEFGFEKPIGAPETTESTLTAGYDKENGFFLSDADKEHFLLRIGGYLQARYTYKGLDNRGADDGGNEGRDQSYFEIERARIKLSGYVLDPTLNYVFQLDGDTDDEAGVEILDVYVLYKAGALFSENKDAFSIGVGQWKPHFLREEQTSSSRLQFVERNLANEFFNLDRQIGVWVQGYLKPLFYSFAVTNGFDSYNVSPDGIDQIPAFIAKLDLDILGETAGKYTESNVSCGPDPVWTVGLSAAADGNNGTAYDDQQEFTCYTFGIDTAFKLGIFSFQAEYMGRWLNYPSDNTVPGMEDDGSTHYAQGLYAQAGVFIWPEVVELAVRGAGIWGGTGGRDGGGYEAGPGLNFYISHSHRVKLQTDVMFFDISPNVPVQSERLDVLVDPTDPEDLENFTAFSSSAASLEAGDQGVMWRTQLQLEF